MLERALVNPLCLRLWTGPDGHPRVAVGGPLERAAEGAVDPGALQAAERALAALQARPHGVIRPGADGRLLDLEEAAGRALAGVLASAGAPWARLWLRLGEGWSQGQTAALVVESAEPRYAALPWELLAEGPDGPVLARSRSDLRVQRLAPGLSAPRQGERPRMVLWPLDPADEATILLVERRRALAGRLGLEVSGPDPEPAPGALDVLHVLAHGRRAAGALEVLAEGGPVTPGDAVGALLQAISGAAAVLLEICESAGDGDSLWDNLAARVCHAGAPVVIAPRRPALLPALDALAEGLWGALAAGEPWSAAVNAGLGAVSRRRLAVPDARAWIFQEHRAGLAPGEPLSVHRGALAGLGRLSAEILELLRAAEALAGQDGRGFVGLEHLALAAVEAPRRGGRTGLGAGLLGMEAHLRALLQGFTPATSRALSLTPRLTRLLQGLGPSDDLEAFWAAATACGGPLDPLGALRSVGGDGSTVGSSVTGPPRGPVPASPLPPTGLEVVGGPEDGRLLLPAPGQTVGRWDPAGQRTSDLPLFEGGLAADLQVSRGEHLRWLGPGRLHLNHSGIRERRGLTEAVPRGELRLLVGDLLRLGRRPGMALRAVEGA